MLRDDVVIWWEEAKLTAVKALQAQEDVEGDRKKSDIKNVKPLNIRTRITQIDIRPVCPIFQETILISAELSREGVTNVIFQDTSLVFFINQIKLITSGSYTMTKDQTKPDSMVVTGRNLDSALRVTQRSELCSENVVLCCWVISAWVKADVEEQF
ncbi:hypothetical protein F511_09665 [Dorcoceras hygrometricum]|uniref:Uncharacterized protein n=1 Tax=Dorcoceras hygrometricum TaxID=472368 RepID=A0A2Z7AGK9_9LAMI|nr:hypothetical protein F511_09665 [Dorcoceras hygrometricum]